MSYYLYILKNITGQHYVGATGNLERRLSEHDRGQASFTRSRGPWALVHLEEYRSFADARLREAEIKKKKRKSYIEWLIE